MKEDITGRDPDGSGSHLSGDAVPSSSLRDIDPSRIEDDMGVTPDPNGFLHERDAYMKSVKFMMEPTYERANYASEAIRECLRDISNGSMSWNARYAMTTAINVLIDAKIDQALGR